MSPGPIFDRVYLALKEQLIRGRYAPGDHLEPSSIGAELSASITPVRDALHRLVGERMVDVPRNDGFRVPAPTEAELRGLYAWNRLLLDLALSRRAVPRDQSYVGASAPAFSDPGTAAGIVELFRSIARRGGNAEHERAIANVGDRLGAFRVAERRVFEDLDAERLALVEAFRRNDDAALRRGLGAYHRRRQRHVPYILVAARAPSPEPPQTTSL